MKFRAWPWAGEDEPLRSRGSGLCARSERWPSGAGGTRGRGTGGWPGRPAPDPWRSPLGLACLMGARGISAAHHCHFSATHTRFSGDVS